MTREFLLTQTVEIAEIASRAPLAPIPHNPVDRYLRRENTPVARLFHAVSPREGKDYRNSNAKRRAELLITTPAAIVATPVIGVLGLTAKIEDHGSAFFVQKRVGENGMPINVPKIRTMVDGVHKDMEAWEETQKLEPGDDPRNTRLGRIIRPIELDELPQLWQIVRGKMSLVDLRILPQSTIDYIRQNKTAKVFSEWQEAYLAGKPGLLNLHSALNNERKNDLKRHHYDMLHARKASLGIDLYIIYRTALRMLKKLEDKIKKKI